VERIQSTQRDLQDGIIDVPQARAAMDAAVQGIVRDLRNRAREAGRA
jgi:hypothetical protein